MASAGLAVTGALLLADLIVASFAGKTAKNLKLVFEKYPVGEGVTRQPNLRTYLKNMVPVVGAALYRNVKAEIAPAAQIMLLLFEVTLVWTLGSTVIAIYEIEEVDIGLALFAGFFLAILNIFLLLVFWPVYFKVMEPDEGNAKYMLDRERQPSFSFEVYVVALVLVQTFLTLVCLKSIGSDFDWLVPLSFLVAELVFHLLLRLVLLVLIKVCGLHQCLMLPAGPPMSKKEFEGLLNTPSIKRDPLKPRHPKADDSFGKNSADVTVFQRGDTSMVESLVSSMGYSDTFTKAARHPRAKHYLPNQWNVATTHLQYEHSGSIAESFQENVIHSEEFEDSGFIHKKSPKPKKKKRVFPKEIDRSIKFTGLYPILEERAKPRRKTFKTSSVRAPTLSSTDQFPTHDDTRQRPRPKKKLRRSLSPPKIFDSPVPKLELSNNKPRASLDDPPSEIIPRRPSIPVHQSPSPLKESNLPANKPAQAKLGELMSASEWTDRNELPHIESPTPADAVSFQHCSALFMDDEIDDQFEEQPFTPSPVESNHFEFEGPPDYSTVCAEEFEEPEPIERPTLPLESTHKKPLPPIPTKSKHRIKKSAVAPVSYSSPYLEPLYRRLPPDSAKNTSLRTTGRNPSLQRSSSNSKLATTPKGLKSLARVRSSDNIQTPHRRNLY